MMRCGAFLSLLLLPCLARAQTSSRGNLMDPDNQNIRLTEPERLVEYNNRNYTCEFALLWGRLSSLTHRPTTRIHSI